MSVYQSKYNPRKAADFLLTSKLIVQVYTMDERAKLLFARNT